MLGETEIGVGSSLLLASSRCHRRRGVRSAQVLDQSLEVLCGGGHEELLGGLSEPPEPEPADFVHLSFL